MNKKIIGIFICINFIIIAALPVIGIESLKSDKDNILSYNFSTDTTQNFSVDITRPKGLYIYDIEIPIAWSYNLIIGPITIEAYCTIDETPVDRAEFHIYNMLGYEVFNETIYKPEKPTLYSIWPDIGFFKHTIEVIIFDDQNNSAIDRINIWKFLWLLLIEKNLQYSKVKYI